jgi:hypothetical protein
MSDPKSTPVVTAVQALFVLNAVIWIFLGALYLWQFSSDSGGLSYADWIVAGLMFANALAMLLLALIIGKRRRIYYFLALAVLAVNILLTVTDEFGLLDLVVLLLGLAILVLLVGGRRRYLPPASGDQ